MITTRHPILGLRSGVVVILALIAALFYAGGGNPAVYTASASASPLQSVPAVALTVPAGSSASLEVQAIALQPGAALPQGGLSLAQTPLASDRVRTALYYGINWGYTATDPQQVALAVWWAQSGQWLAGDHSIAQRIADAAAGAPGLPSWNADGRSISSLLAQGQLALSSLSLSASALSPASGHGTLVIRNSGTQDALVYLPYGSIFADGTATAIVWAVGPGEAPQQPTTTAAAPSQSPTTAPPQASPTTPSGYKGSYVAPTEEATATAAPAVKPPPAQEPPSPTATALPTQAPPEPRATQAPAPTATTATAASDTTAKAPTASQPVAPAAAQPPPVSQIHNPSNASTDGGQPAQRPARLAAAPAIPSVTAISQSPAAGNPGAATGSAAGPTLPTPAATSTPSPTKATSATGGAPAPAPIGTTQPSVVPQPQPELTKLPTIGIAPTAAATTAAATTAPAKPTEPPTPTTLVKEVPTPAPQKAPAPTDGPVITVAPPAPTDGVNTLQNQPTTARTGSGQPTTTPTTGGGPSPLPVWLTVFSTIMVLGGWSLRRMSAVEAEPVEATEEHTD